jgi:major membrane immunogen (membrane-anchored lipoprotein)
MRKILLFAVVMMLIAGVSYAKDFAASKKAGQYNITLKMEGDPVPVAENKASIEIKDASGPVSGADVELYYFMPSMPSMNYTAKAEPKNGAYAAVIKPTMPGGWKVDVKVKGSDGKVHKAVFEFNAK